MVTARSQSEDVVKALELGANDYLTKPVDFPVALARVQHSPVALARRTGAARERGALRAGRARRQRRPLGLESARRHDLLFVALEVDARLRRSRDRRSVRRSGSSRIHEADRDKVKRRIDQHINGETPHFEAEARMLHKDGVFRWMLSRGMMIRDAAGKPLRMAGSQTDITEGKVADPMTGLPNRLLFLDRLSRVIAHTNRHPETIFARPVPGPGRLQAGERQPRPRGRRPAADQRGESPRELLAAHRHAGASRRQLHLRPPGRRRVRDYSERSQGRGRCHGSSRPTAPRAGGAIRRRQQGAVHLGQYRIALSTLGHSQPEDYVRDADTAMYRAKALGKGRCEVFDADMRALITDRLQIENDLRRALDRHELRNVYQPIISLESRHTSSRSRR